MTTLPTWRQMNRDTSPQIEAIYLERLRHLSAREKIEMLVGLNEAVLTFTLLGIRRRHPDADETEVRQHLAHLLLGDDLAQRFLAATQGA